MRTTVRLDDALLTEAKKLAADSGRSLTAVIEDALREVISRRRSLTPRNSRIVFPELIWTIQPPCSTSWTTFIDPYRCQRPHPGRLFGRTRN
jgi:hypothetical protein